MDERRQLPRWQVKKEAKVWLPLMQEFCHCTIEDINLKGMCLSFSKRLPPFKVMDMDLALDGDFDFIKIEIKLPWSAETQAGHAYGVLFNKIRDCDKDRLDKYINKNCYEQFKDKWWAV